MSERPTQSASELAETLLSLVLDRPSPVSIECWAAGDGLPPGTSYAGNDVLIASGVASARGRRRDVASHGTGGSPSQRIISAILEVAERLAFHEVGADRHACFDALREEARCEVVDPRDCVLPTGLAEDSLPFAAGTRVDWARARTIAGRPRWVHRQTSFGARGFYEGTTNGLATGQGTPDAVLRGALEVIERDAVLLHWFGRFGAPRLPAPPSTEPLVDFLRTRGFTVELFDLTTDLGVSVVMSVLAYGAGPLDLPAGAQVVSAGAGFGLAAAAAKALYEAVQTVEHIALHEAHGSLAKALGPHLRYYLEANRSNECDRGAPEAVTTLDALARVLEGHGLELLYRELTPKWLRETPVNVVEVWVPGLHPLELCLPARRVASARLLAFGERAGTKPAVTVARALACPPHPLG
jgi:thiazole/oxazole-forming peptide maturase SagD family component